GDREAIVEVADAQAGAQAVADTDHGDATSSEAVGVEGGPGLGADVAVTDARGEHRRELAVTGDPDRSDGHGDPHAAGGARTAHLGERAADQAVLAADHPRRRDAATGAQDDARGGTRRA